MKGPSSGSGNGVDCWEALEASTTTGEVFMKAMWSRRIESAALRSLVGRGVDKLFVKEVVKSVGGLVSTLAVQWVQWGTLSYKTWRWWRWCF